MKDRKFRPNLTTPDHRDVHLLADYINPELLETTYKNGHIMIVRTYDDGEVVIATIIGQIILSMQPLEETDDREEDAASGSM